MNNFTPLKHNQLLARPVQFNPPTPEESNNATLNPINNATLNPIETKCVNIRLRESLGRQEYTPKQLELLHRVNQLSSNIYNPQLNKWRLFLSHLVIMPKNLNFSQISMTDLQTKQIKTLNKGEFCSRWNESLLRVYCIIETSCYMGHEEKSKCVESLEYLRNLIQQETFKNQNLSDSVKSDLQLLIDALQNDELLAILLAPLDNPSDHSLTPEKIDCFLKIIKLARAGASRCIDETKKLPKQSKITTTRLLNDWMSRINELESRCSRLLELQNKALAGSEEALFNYSEELKHFHSSKIHGYYEKEIFPGINKAVPQQGDFQLILESYLRNSFALLLRTSQALFDTPYSQLETATEFIRKLKPKLTGRSDYFSPLDIYRMWWMEPLLEEGSATEDLGNLEMLFQILRDPDDNIYGPIEDLETFFKKLKEPKTQSLHEEPYNLFKSLLKNHSYQHLIGWLNAPLNDKDYEGDDTDFFLRMKLQFAKYLSMVEDVSIQEPINTTQNNKLQQYRNKLIQLHQEAELTAGETKHDKKESLDHFARTAFSIYGDDSIEQLEKLLSESPDLDRETKNHFFMLNEDMRKLYLTPCILRGADLAPLKAPKKRRHRTSNQEQIQAKPKAAKQKQRAYKKNPEPQSHMIEPSIQNAFEILLQSSPHRLHFNLRNLITLLEDPISVEAIYCSLARTLEAHFQPEQNHSLEEFGKNDEEILWLKKMQSFLPLRFVPSEINPDELEEDLKRTALLLGVQTVPAFSLNRPEHSEEEIWTSRFKNSLQLSRQRLNKEGISPINGEYLLERRIRLTLCKDILDFSEATLLEIEQILKEAKERALPPPLLGHLILKVGQLAEGSMKLNFLTAPIASEADPQSHRAFEEVAGRPRRYDHDLARVYEVSNSVVRIDQSEIELIQKWRHFATAARYETSPNNCQLTLFLKKAALLYPEFLTLEESKELKQLGLEGKGREELLRMQQEELIPEVEKLLEMSLKLF